MSLLESKKNRIDVLMDVNWERDRQVSLRGVQYHDYPTWYTILGEEIGEVAQAIQKDAKWSKETDSSDLYTELIHVAAVAVQIAEQVREERIK